jgi:hypothetical protein
MASATFQLKAADETAQAFASVQNRFDRLGVKVKEMNASFIGKGLLAGLGIGGGLQVAQTLIEKITDSYKESADFAKYIEESTKRSLEYTLRSIKEARTPEQQMAQLIKDQKEIIKQREELEKPFFFYAPAQPGSFFDKSKEGGMKQADKTMEQKKAIADLIESENKLAEEMKKVQDKITEGEKKRFDDIETLRMQDQDRKIAAGQKGLEIQENETKKIISAQEKETDAVVKKREELEKLAQGYLDIVSPSNSFIRQIEEVNKLSSDGKLSIKDAAQAVDLLTLAMKKNEESRIKNVLDEFFGGLDKAQEMMDDLQKELAQPFIHAGEIIAQSFEDAIISGQKLSDVVRALGQDLLRLVFSQTITDPLAKGITAKLLGIPLMAMGGPVSAGSPYVVGERGPELFVPSSSGSIVSNSKMSSGGGGGMGGVTVNYNIAAGVSRSELVPILEQERRRLKAEIPDMVRRGGSYRSAFA